MSYIVYDSETGFKEAYGRKGNFKINPIVAMALKNSKELYSEYIYPNKLERFIVDEDILVGFNIKYDLLYIWGLEDLQNFFKRGGKIWDCQEAHYTLTGQQEKYPALREVAVRCYGCKQREKKMEEYWEKGIDTFDIPKELVIEDVEFDVLDTEQVYLKQLDIAKEKGMLNLIESRMDGILALCEYEYNGIYVNRDILETNQKLLEDELKIEKEKLNNLVQRYWK